MGLHNPSGIDNIKYFMLLKHSDIIFRVIFTSRKLKALFLRQKSEEMFSIEKNTKLIPAPFFIDVLPQKHRSFSILSHHSFKVQTGKGRAKVRKIRKCWAGMNFKCRKLLQNLA